MFQSDGGFPTQWFVPDSGFRYFNGIYLFTSGEFESESETFSLRLQGGRPFYSVKMFTIVSHEEITRSTLDGVKSVRLKWISCCCFF